MSRRGFHARIDGLAALGKFIQGTARVTKPRGLCQMGETFIFILAAHFQDGEIIVREWVQWIEHKGLLEKALCAIEFTQLKMTHSKIVLGHRFSAYRVKRR